MQRTDVDRIEFSGQWEFHSFRSDKLQGPIPDDTPASAFIFGEGVLQLEVSSAGNVTGTLDMGSGYVLDIEGKVRSSHEPDRQAATLAASGSGRRGSPTAGWKYSYVGYMVPSWPGGIGEQQCFVGTVVRDAAHGPKAPAGYVAPFVSVRAVR